MRGTNQEGTMAEIVAGTIVETAEITEETAETTGGIAEDKNTGEKAEEENTGETVEEENTVGASTEGANKKERHRGQYRVTADGKEEVGTMRDGARRNKRRAGKRMLLSRKTSTTEVNLIGERITYI